MVFSLLSLLAKKQPAPPEQPEDSDLPLAELNQHLGKIIEVNYIQQGQERVETSQLVFPASDRHFYLREQSGYHIIHWNHTDHQGNLFAVKLIKAGTDSIIYQNDQLPFDYSKLRKEDSKK